MRNKIAYVGGTFDLFHAGHINIINKCMIMGFEPVIVVNSDEFVLQYRAKPCVFNELERIRIIREFYPDVEIRLVDKDKQREFILDVKPAVIVVGSDWLKPEILSQLGITVDLLRDNNISLLIIPRFESISTKIIKEKMKE